MTVSQVYPVNEDLVDHKVHREMLVHQVLMDVPVKMEQMEPMVLLALQGKRVMQETSEISELTESEEHMDHQGTQDQEENKDQAECEDLTVPTVLQE